MTSGVDAYEYAADFAASNRWRIIRFNLLWFIGAVLGWIIINAVFLSASPSLWTWLITTLLHWLFVLPIWETANTIKFRYDRRLTGDIIVRVLIERLAFYLILLFTYAVFLVPGIYCHSRLLLHTSIISRDRSGHFFHGLRESWRLTKGHGIAMYSLWIITVISKPVCALPFGLAFIFERPLSGFAKDIMVQTLTDTLPSR